VSGVDVPAVHKPRVSVARDAHPTEVRRLLGDGCFGGFYERPDEDVFALWRVGVDEARGLLEVGWE
jgi:creatinine amidohydrolase